MLLTGFKTILQETQISREGFGRVSMFDSLLEKNGFVCFNQFSHFKVLSHYLQPYKIGFRLLRGLKTILLETQKYGEGSGTVSTFSSFSQKNVFVFVNQFSHFKTLSHYFQPYKIRLKLLTGLKTILQETQIQRECFERFPIFASLSLNNGVVFLNQFLHFKALRYYFQRYKSRFRLLTGFKTTLQETQIQGESFRTISTFASLSRKNGFGFVNQFLHFKALSHYFQPYKIRFRPLKGFKTTLQETKIQEECFRRVSTFASLSQKNVFLFVNQFSHFRTLSHYFQPHKIGFRVLRGFKTILQEIQIYGEGLGRISTFAWLSQKNGFAFVNQFSHFNALSHCFQPYKFRFRLLRGFKTILQETQIYRAGFGTVSTFAPLSQKNAFVFVNEFSHFKALNHYFQPYKIRFRLLKTFTTILQETQIQGQSLPLSLKNGFVFVMQFSQFKAFRYYFQLYKTRFRLLTGFKTILQETQIYGKGF